MNKLQIIRVDDEHIKFALNGEIFAYLDHDEDGWAGMSKMENTLKTLANKLDIKVEEIEE